MSSVVPRSPVDVVTLLDVAYATREGISVDDPSFALSEKLLDARFHMVELLAAGGRADGDQRPNRPERGPGYGDAEWALFLQGWDAHADAVYGSGLRAALRNCNSGPE